MAELEKKEGSTTDLLPFRKVEFHLARKSISSSFLKNGDFKLETLNPTSSKNAVQSSSSKIDSNGNSSSSNNTSDFLDAALDLDLSFRMSFRRIGAGLENLGNTCFLNSVLQCLTYTEPLVAYLQSGKHHINCHIAGFCALCAIQKHVSRALQSTGRILAPKDLVSNLRCISRNFRNARQEDAHEYMIHLLESMHKCCLPSGVPAQSPGAYDKSWVHKIFGGRLRSQVRCQQCSYCSNTFDPFLDLSLEIVKADSLYKALKHFTAAEQLDGGEKQYKCEKCKQKVRALKQLTVYKAPYVLTIHLKRFRSHFSGQKIDKKVQFGSVLDLKPFVSGAYEGDLMYTLYGVLVHAGWSTHSGHYYSFVRTSTGLWYSLDDNRVVQVSEKTVLEQKAYMLFYVRDRKNFTPKKSMDVVQNGNLITPMRNTSNSGSILGAKVFQNGCAENSRETISAGLFVKESESANTSEVLAQQSKFVSSNDTALKNESSQKVNGSILSEPLGLKRENSVPLKPDSEEIMHSSSKCADGDHARNSAKATGPGASYDNSRKSKKPQSDLLVSAATPTVDCQPTVSTDESCKTSKNTIGVAPDTKVVDALLSGDNSGKLENICQSVSAIPKSSESEICKEGALEPASDIPSILSRSKTTLSSANESSPQRSSSTPRRRLKKKVLKSRVAGMHLSTKILFGESLSLMKRRKCKRKKLSQKNILQGHLLTQHLVSVDIAPSTSVSVSNVADIDVKSQTKLPSSFLRGGEKDTTKESAANCNRESPIGELKERNTDSHTVLATSKLPQESCKFSLEVNDTNIGDSQRSNSQLQNGVTRAFSCELQETTVGRWEDTESPSEIVDSKGRDSVSIGYVPDDWDEEYDRGKRKKLRGLRDSFGGPNPFQEVAAKKAKLKTNAKQHNHVNQPFRLIPI